MHINIGRYNIWDYITYLYNTVSGVSADACTACTYACIMHGSIYLHYHLLIYRSIIVDK